MSESFYEILQEFQEGIQLELPKESSNNLEMILEKKHSGVIRFENIQWSS